MLWACSLHKGKQIMHTTFLFYGLIRWGHFRHVGIDVKTALNLILKEQSVKIWAVGLLWTWWLILWFFNVNKCLDQLDKCQLVKKRKKLCQLAVISGFDIFVFLFKVALMFTLYLPCIFVQLINSHQQMHQNRFVTGFFIKRFPQYAFRHFYIAIIRGIVGVWPQATQTRKKEVLPYSNTHR